MTRLRRERQRAISALGAAAYEADDRAQDDARERLAALDSTIEDREQAARKEVEHARAEVASSRLSAQSTREFSRR